MKIKLKIGRYYCNIGEDDVILNKGVCYQVVTQLYMQGRNTYPVEISKKLFNDFRKLGIIYTYSLNNRLTYWKFDIEYMKRCGCEVVEG